MKHQVVVIGGGSAGYAAARTAHQAGAEVAVIDQGPLGGLCILRGCMPTKALLRSASAMALARRGPEFGLATGNPTADWGAVMQRKDRLVAEFAGYRTEQLRDGRFTLYEDRARFLAPMTLDVGGRVISAERIIIATGSVPQRLAVPGLSTLGPWTSDDALELQQQPESLIVLGGGPVALELAQFFQRLGTRVTLVQRSPHVLSQDDADLAAPLEARLRQEGMALLTDTRLLEFGREGDQIVARLLQAGKPVAVRAAAVLEAAGRRPAIDDLDLDRADVAVAGGRVVVDARMETSQPGVFAVGDVNGQHEVVHIAIQQGEVAGFNAARPDLPPRTVDDRLQAHVTFTDPQVASVGLSEKACQARGVAYRAATYAFADHGMAMCLGETHGHVKLLCTPDSGELLGAHIVGPEACELVHELIAVMHFRGTVADLAAIPHYHPTLAEIVTYPAEELAEQIRR